MGDVGGEGRKPLEGVVKPRQHGVEGAHQFHQFLGHLVGCQAGSEGAGGYTGCDFGHAVQGPQAAACGPAPEQGGGQGGKPHGEPDQTLHAFEEVLVVGDVQCQGDARRDRVFSSQGRTIGPVVGAVLLPVVQTVAPRGAEPFGAVEPVSAVAALQAQGEIRVQAQFGLQGVQARRQGGGAVHFAHQRAEGGQPAFQQLLVEFDEVGLAGAAEEHASGQRDGGGAGGEQQAEAGSEGESAHQPPRASST
ncbi:hypothetical protein D3C84_730660 [compost metagenome]